MSTEPNVLLIRSGRHNPRITGCYDPGLNDYENRLMS